MIVLAAVLVFAACHKYYNSTIDATTNPELFAVVTAAEVDADGIFNNVADNVLGTNSYVGLGTGIGVFTALPDSVSPCFTVTISPADTTTFPKTVTIDFGSGCTGQDGHLRMGQIITVYSGPLSRTGSTATTTFNNYYFDSFSVQGTHVITNISTADTLMFSTAVQNGLLIETNGDSIEWSKTKTWKLVSGQNTQPLLDDMFSISGTSSGTVAVNDSVYNDSTQLYTPNFVQQQWSAAITEPYIHEFTCQWIVEGEEQITLGNLEALLDYGDGTCDNQALLTFNAYHFEVTLP